MENKPLNLFEYSDYRTFLREYSEVKRQSKQNWSYGVWARQLGFSNTAALANILNGHRFPGKKAIERFCDYFEFADNEKLYFGDLVRLQKVDDDPRLTVMIMESLAQLHPSGTFQLLKESDFKAISKWHYYAIRELINVRDFKSDAEWISNRLPGVGVREVKKALADLVSLGLIGQDPNGNYVQSIKHVQSTDGIASEALKQFHEGMIDQAKLALRTVDVDDRDITNMTFVMNKSQLPAAKENLKKFRREFMKMFETQNGDDVYQMNFQLFPLTKEKEL